MDNRKSQICVSLSPDLLRPETLGGRIAVVADVIRASTTVCFALGAGATHVRTVARLEECQEWQRGGYLAAAERNSEKLSWADLPNTPGAFTPERVGGRNIVLCTTNGTIAVQKALAAEALWIGCFANLEAVARKAEADGRDLLVVCAGWEGAPSLEDTCFAGALAQRLARTHKPGDDACRIAVQTYLAFVRKPCVMLRQNDSVQRLFQLNLKADVRSCLRRNTQDLVPVFGQVDGIFSI